MKNEFDRQELKFYNNTMRSHNQWDTILMSCFLKLIQILDDTRPSLARVIFSTENIHKLKTMEKNKKNLIQSNLPYKKKIILYVCTIYHIQ